MAHLDVDGAVDEGNDATDAGMDERLLSIDDISDAADSIDDDEIEDDGVDDINGIDGAGRVAARRADGKSARLIPLAISNRGVRDIVSDDDTACVCAGAAATTGCAGTGVGGVGAGAKGPVCTGVVALVGCDT